jgi:exodeoxyribonuclease VII small subunit
MAKLSFEQALQNLEQIVTEIEQGKVPLEASIEKYAQGIALIKQCRAILETAEKKIQLLSRGEDGAQVTGELEEPTETAQE